MRYLILSLLAALMFCALPASGQTWHSAFNDQGAAFPNGHALKPPGMQGYSAAYYKLTGATGENTNVLNVASCKEVVITTYPGDGDGTPLTGDATPGVLCVIKVPDDAATTESRISVDVDGNGVINATDTAKCLNSDWGDDTADADSTAEQRAHIYGITGVNRFYLDSNCTDCAAPGAGDSIYAEVSCR
jgi:hypothetical protein